MALFDFLKKRDDRPSTAGLIQDVARRLETLPPATARFVTGFACVLGRIAHADSQFDERETRTMVDLVQMAGQLSSDEATLVVELAKTQHRLFGHDHHAKLTRQLKRALTAEQRRNLVHCIIAVAAADQLISRVEEKELRAVASELSLDREEFEMILASYGTKRELKNG